jgi:hypothetical protein
MWEVRVYVCMREVIKDNTGLERLLGSVKKSFVCWVTRRG